MGNQCQYGNEYIYPTFTSLEHGDEFACRSVVQAQVSMLDSIVGGVEQILRDAGQWDNTLLIFASDNGGSLELNDTAGNNWPLRGGKSSFLEGGIRSTSFVSGGFLPEERRGKREDGLMHIADWYKTLCGPSFAAVDWRDTTAAEADLPPVDGYDLWPLLSGAQTESPRRELVISSSVLIMGDYKLVVGKQEYAVWTESRWPTASTPTQYELKHTKLKCSTRSPCLFNVARDPTERDDLADDMLQEVEQMQNRFEQLAQDFFYNQQQGEDSCPAIAMDTEEYCGCWMAFHNYNAVNSEVQTPHLDGLVRNGLELNRHYVYSGCAPTRASFQSGRLPVHVTTNNGDGLEDPTHGIPTQMTGLASKLREGGYSTHLVGKWDCGFSTWDRLPRAKGYDSFYGYLGKSLGYFSKLGDNDCSETDFADLWEDDAPALSSLDELDGEYVELMFAQRVQDVIV